MKLIDKNYKLQIIKNSFENSKFLFFIDKVNSKESVKYDSFNVLNGYIVPNRLLKVFFHCSIYSRFLLLITGLTCVIQLKSYYSSNIDYKFSVLKTSTTSSLLIGIKLNNKFYSFVQLNKIKTFNYLKNINGLYKLLIFFLVFTSLKLTSK